MLLLKSKLKIHYAFLIVFFIVNPISSQEVEYTKKEATVFVREVQKNSDFTEIKLTSGKYYNQKYGFTISNIPDFLKITEAKYDFSSQYYKQKSALLTLYILIEHRILKKPLGIVVLNNWANELIENAEGEYFDKMGSPGVYVSAVNDDSLEFIFPEVGSYYYLEKNDLPLCYRTITTFRMDKDALFIESYIHPQIWKWFIRNFQVEFEKPFRVNDPKTATYFNPPEEYFQFYEGVKTIPKYEKHLLNWKQIARFYGVSVKRLLKYNKKKDKQSDFPKEYVFIPMNKLKKMEFKDLDDTIDMESLKTILQREKLK